MLKYIIVTKFFSFFPIPFTKLSLILTIEKEMLYGKIKEFD